MCTVIIIRNIVKDYPLIIAANRDELYSRPSRKPSVLSDWEEAYVVGPSDLLKNGTWLAISKKSKMVATITNQGDEPEKNKISRGQLVIDSLNEDWDDLEHLKKEFLCKIDISQYNEFNLVISDAYESLVTYNHGQLKPIISSLPDNISVVSNNNLTLKSQLKANYLKNLVHHLVSSFKKLDDIRVGLQKILSDHYDYSLGAYHDASVCVHEEDYGTKSSSIVAVGESIDYWFAEGAPCKTEFKHCNNLGLE